MRIKKCTERYVINDISPDSKIHGANNGPICVLSAPDGPHVGPMNFAIREVVRRESMLSLCTMEVKVFGKDKQLDH